MLLNAFDREIHIHLPGVPQPVVEWGVLWSARQFCEDSLVVRRDVQVTTIEGIDAYEIELPDDTDAEVALVISATLDDRPLVAGTDYVWDAAGSQFVLTEEPEAAQTLKLKVAIEPIVDASVVPDDLLGYMDVIGAGARQKIAAMPGQTWTNPDVEKRAGTVFKVGINAAQIAANRSHVRKSLTVTPRRFA